MKKCKKYKLTQKKLRCEGVENGSNGKNKQKLIYIQLSNILLLKTKKLWKYQTQNILIETIINVCIDKPIL